MSGQRIDGPDKDFDVQDLIQIDVDEIQLEEFEKEIPDDGQEMSFSKRVGEEEEDIEVVVGSPPETTEEEASSKIPARKARIATKTSRTEKEKGSHPEVKQEIEQLKVSITQLFYAVCSLYEITEKTFNLLIETKKKEESKKQEVEQKPSSNTNKEKISSFSGKNLFLLLIPLVVLLILLLLIFLAR